MGEKSTIESLISTSGEDDFDSLPLFQEGKIIKRISKEEIQGWNQNHQRQAFQKKTIEIGKRKTSTQLKKHRGLAENFELQCLAPPPSLKTIKKQLHDYGETGDLFPAFRTLNHLPQVNVELTLPKVTIRQEPKEDYVKGRKFMNFVPRQRKTTTLKPLLSPTKPNSKKTIRIRSKSLSVNQGCKEDKQTNSKISIISYPLDMAQPQKDDYQVYQGKLNRYMRKYQMNVFL